MEGIKRKNRRLEKERESEASTACPAGPSPGSSHGLVLSNPHHWANSRGSRPSLPMAPTSHILPHRASAHTCTQTSSRQKEPPTARPSVLEGPGARARPRRSPAGCPRPTSRSPISASVRRDVRARCLGRWLRRQRRPQTARGGRDDQQGRTRRWEGQRPAGRDDNWRGTQGVAYL